jgi:uncharacterized protein YecE (DUF72 family)
MVASCGLRHHRGIHFGCSSCVTGRKYGFANFAALILAARQHAGRTSSAAPTLARERLARRDEENAGEYKTDDVLGRFCEAIGLMGHRRGAVLFQLPPFYKKDVAILAAFLKILPRDLKAAFEFRHASWFTDEIYRLLSDHGAALCIADSPKYPRREIATTTFMYIRYHGRSKLFASNYTKSDLSQEAEKIRRYLHEGQDVYAYFNNDAKGYAVANARMLTTMI